MQKRPNVCSYEDVFESESVDFFCDPAFNKQLIIAEGDSWFTIGGNKLKDPWFKNILFTLRFQEETLIVNLAQPGDTIKSISDMTRDRSFKDSIREHSSSKPWNAILLSAGGNDLIGKAHTLMLNKQQRGNVNKPADYFDATKVNAFFDDLETNYRHLAKARGNRKIPIVAHTYDYATPRNSPARFFGIGLLGPWLYKVMLSAEIPKSDWIAVSDYLFNKLAERILGLSRGHNKIPDFHVVDTRNQLIRAKLDTRGEDGDWMNEIHPNKNGYKKIARLIEQKLKMIGATN